MYLLVGTLLHLVCLLITLFGQTVVKNQIVRIYRITEEYFFLKQEEERTTVITEETQALC